LANGYTAFAVIPFAGSQGVFARLAGSPGRKSI